METFATREEAQASTEHMTGWGKVEVVQFDEPDITGEQRWYVTADGHYFCIGGYAHLLGTSCNH